MGRKQENGRRPAQAVGVLQCWSLVSVIAAMDEMLKTAPVEVSCLENCG